MSYSAKQTLAGIDLFAGVPADVIADLANAGTSLTASPGTAAVQQGGGGAGLHVILEGSAEVEVGGEARQPLGPGDYFGEISLIDGKPRSATVTAGPDGLTTYAISSLNFKPLIDKHPSLASALLVALCARIRTLEESTAAEPS